MVALKRTFTIAGLNVDVFSDPSISSESLPIVAFFLLHGRLSSSKSVEPIAESLVQLTREASKSSDSQSLRQNLIVITFDHRNHGTRLLDTKANNGWSKDSEKNNDKHAIDMYGIQTGTARDVSFLIDFLPAYLYPLEERTITWGVAGISLGGHSTWLSLCSDPRVKIGIPIIGCPDFLVLMTGRAMQHSLTLEPPYIPSSLLSYIHQHDPPSTPYYTLDTSNPFLDKKILVLSGGMDTIVPWSASKEFVEKLEVGKDGRKVVVVIPDAGHECTTAMVDEMARFIETEVLQVS